MRTALHYHHRILGFAVIACLTGASHGQDTDPSAFEVASIRRNLENGPQRLDLFPQFTAQNATLKALFLLAYEVKEFQVSSAPTWFDSDRYDISAKMEGAPVPGPAAMQLQRRRLQLLLQDRFKLAVHHEARERPVYKLTTARGGPKVTASACTEPDPKNPATAPGKTFRDYCGWSGFSKGRFEASSATTADLVKALSNLLGRSVLDETGMKGTFRVDLKFADDDATKRTGDAPLDVPAADDNAPNIFTALQEQLGLKLNPGRGAVDVIIIDHVEKPSEN